MSEAEFIAKANALILEMRKDTLTIKIMLRSIL